MALRPVQVRVSFDWRLEARPCWPRMKGGCGGAAETRARDRELGACGCGDLILKLGFCNSSPLLKKASTLWIFNFFFLFFSHFILHILQCLIFRNCNIPRWTRSPSVSPLPGMRFWRTRPVMSSSAWCNCASSTGRESHPYRIERGLCKAMTNDHLALRTTRSSSLRLARRTSTSLGSRQISPRAAGS